MEISTRNERKRLQQLHGTQLKEHQIQRFNRLLFEILPHNRFYAEKLSEVGLPLTHIDEMSKLPYTFKDELATGERAVNLSFPLERYVRFHRTSGTRGRPVIVMDTAADWQWWINAWQYALDAADLCAEDRAVVAFSFGASISMWAAFDASIARGMLVASSGGMSSMGRLDLIRSVRATAIVSTPSYALHLADVAQQHQIDVAQLDVRHVIVTGEPGGSIAAVRDQIESAWGAKVIDQCGATEIGPWGFADASGEGIYVNESEFIAEFLSVETGQRSAPGDLSELVLTSLGRAGCPVIRYRSGDLVRPFWDHPGDCRFVWLEGGLLGRVDEMMIIRGVNVFPSAIENILRGFPELIEYRMTAEKAGAMDKLTVEIEDRLHDPTRVAEELKLQIELNVDVRCVPVGTLPRFESIGKRFVDRR